MPLHLVFPHKQMEGEVTASVIETVIPSALKGKQKRFAPTQCVIRKLTFSLFLSPSAVSSSFSSPALQMAHVALATS